MNKPEIDNKELEELKKMVNELIGLLPKIYDDNNNAIFPIPPVNNDKMMLALACLKLITVLEYKKEEIEKLKKENRKLKNGMIEQADKIYYLQRICIAAKEYYDAEMNYDYIKSPGLTTRQVSDNSKEWRKVVEKAKQFQQALRELDNDKK